MRTVSLRLCAPRLFAALVLVSTGLSGCGDDDGGNGGLCGNGVRDLGEECDDGNLTEGDGCSAQCLVVARCGDGRVDVGEECDDGNITPGDGCDASCTTEIPTSCGNGTVDPGEQCDSGGESATCDIDCTWVFCGDSLLNTTAGEECEDNNFINGDGCSASCRLDGDVCGNGVVGASEECDDANQAGGDGCAADCTIEVPTTCGDGIVNGVEECDDSGESATCDVDCTFSECGDTILNFTAGEQCEDGNQMGFDGCSATCQQEHAACGNGVIEGVEECDDNNLADGDGCAANCTLEMSVTCGDGTLDVGEDCDHTGESATCDVDCTSAQCGDGVLNVTSGEQCEDGNNLDGDGCSANCTIEGCGNGTVEAGEDCDDGNLTDGDGCASDCTVEIASTCGDSTLDAGEECDDGNNSNGDGCSAGCFEEVADLTITYSLVDYLQGPVTCASVSLGAVFYRVLDPLDNEVASGTVSCDQSTPVVITDLDFGTYSIEIDAETEWYWFGTVVGHVHNNLLGTNAIVVIGNN